MWRTLVLQVASQLGAGFARRISNAGATAGSATWLVETLHRLLPVYEACHNVRL
ncbi:hypothetical protein [Neisseria mucosa]|uniref:hypothetical protein n=1 Tax=Neisseria mucosa TaxID=488 RepID=UPI003AFFE46B